MQEYVLWYQELGMHDVNRVGGKNASLGEMISNLANAGVKVPGGFATTAYAFNEFLEQSGLEAKIHEVLDSLDVDDVSALAEAGKNIRQWIIDTPFQGKLEDEIRTAFVTLQGDAGDEASFAVRSSATAEDMPDASFAGQQETFLNVKGYDAVIVQLSTYLRHCLMTGLFRTVCTKATTTKVWHCLPVCSAWCAVISLRRV